MKEYTFPIWTIKSIISDVETQTNKDILIKIIIIVVLRIVTIWSCKHAIMIAYVIGKLCIENKEVK